MSYMYYNAPPSVGGGGRGTYPPLADEALSRNGNTH